ncbi:MAG: hypothetical protein QW255_05355 [Candidatus Bilamarchaeaceae archaeon]
MFKNIIDLEKIKMKFLGLKKPENTSDNSTDSINEINIMVDDYINKYMLLQSIYDNKCNAILNLIGNFIVEDSDEIRYVKKSICYVSENDSYYIVKNENAQEMFKIRKVLVNNLYPTKSDIAFMLNSIVYRFMLSKYKKKINFFEDEKYTYDIDTDNVVFFLFLPDDYETDEEYIEFRKSLYNFKNLVSTYKFIEYEIYNLENHLRKILHFEEETESEKLKNDIKNTKDRINFLTNKKNELSNEIEVQIKELHRFYEGVVNNGITINIDVFKHFYKLIVHDETFDNNFIDYMYSYVSNPSSFSFSFSYLLKALIESRKSDDLFVSIRFNDAYNIESSIALSIVMLSNIYLFFKYYFYGKDFDYLSSIVSVYSPKIILINEKQDKKKEFSLYDAFISYRKYIEKVTQVVVENNLHYVLEKDYNGYIYHLANYINAYRSNKYNIELSILPVKETNITKQDFEGYIFFLDNIKNKYNAAYIKKIASKLQPS